MAIAAIAAGVLERAGWPCFSGALDAGGCRRWLAGAEPMHIVGTASAADDVQVQPVSAQSPLGVVQAVLIANPGVPGQTT